MNYLDRCIIGKFSKITKIYSEISLFYLSQKIFRKSSQKDQNPINMPLIMTNS